MSPNTVAVTLTDEEALQLEKALNEYEPKDVHEALDGIDEPSLRGLQASTNASGPLVAGSAEPGVSIYKLDGGAVRLRITFVDMSGAMYDELEMSVAVFKVLVDTLLAALRTKRAPTGEL